VPQPALAGPTHDLSPGLATPTSAPSSLSLECGPCPLLSVRRNTPRILGWRQIPAAPSPPWENGRLNLALTAAQKSDNTSAFAHLGEEESTVSDVLNAGGIILAGTDSPLDLPSTSLHLNLRAQVKYGRAPWQALETATILPAKAYRLTKDLGTLEPGHLADLIIVSGDPLKNIDDAAKGHGTLCQEHNRCRDLSITLVSLWKCIPGCRFSSKLSRHAGWIVIGKNPQPRTQPPDPTDQSQITHRRLGSIQTVTRDYFRRADNPGMTLTRSAFTGTVHRDVELQSPPARL
jgi:hypothetical protein